MAVVQQPHCTEVCASHSRQQLRVSPCCVGLHIKTVAPNAVEGSRMSRTDSEAAGDHVQSALEDGLPRFLGQSGKGAVQDQVGQTVHS